MKVLVADDDLVSRRLLVAALEKWGYELKVAADGAEAWQVLAGDEPPALAILDWMMPALDGVEICRRVRSLPGRESLYLILLTATTEPADVVEGQRAGA